VGFKVGRNSHYPSVFPAKAGIHSEPALTIGLWIPAFAGKTEVSDIYLIFLTQFELHPALPVVLLPTLPA
jgi:hypothetical protein